MDYKNKYIKYKTRYLNLKKTQLKDGDYRSYVICLLWFNKNR